MIYLRALQLLQESFGDLPQSHLRNGGSQYPHRNGQSRSHGRRFQRTRLGSSEVSIK